MRMDRERGWTIIFLELLRIETFSGLICGRQIGDRKKLRVNCQLPTRKNAFMRGAKDDEYSARHDL
jgi:hypothetical protein